MKFKIVPQSIEWWFWAVTLAAMIFGFANILAGFVIVVLVSAIQVVYFWVLRGFVAFPTQVRTAYLACAVLAFFDPTRIFFGALLVGTLMVTFFDRCIIARVLVHMPWNKNVKLT